METIAAFAKDMGDFLMNSNITGTKAFIQTFVKEIAVRPGRVTIHYTIPTPEDSPMGGVDVADIALSGPVMNTAMAGGPAASPLYRRPGPSSLW